MRCVGVSGSLAVHLWDPVTHDVLCAAVARDRLVAQTGPFARNGCRNCARKARMRGYSHVLDRDRIELGGFIPAARHRPP